MLYGVLEYIATTVAAQDAKLNKLEQQVTTCQALQNELKGLMLEITKSSFSLKEKGYEVCRVNSHNNIITILSRIDLDVVLLHFLQIPFSVRYLTQHLK